MGFNYGFTTHAWVAFVMIMTFSGFLASGWFLGHGGFEIGVWSREVGFGGI